MLRHYNNITNNTYPVSRSQEKPQKHVYLNDNQCECTDIDYQNKLPRSLTNHQSGCNLLSMNSRSTLLHNTCTKRRSQEKALKKLIKGLSYPEHTRKPQFKSKKVVHFLRTWDSIPDADILANVYALVDMLTKAELKILDYYIYCHITYRCVYPSYDTIAAYVGCRSRTVGRAVKKFRDLGLLGKVPRYDLTPFYKLSSFFSQYVVVKKLRAIFPSLLALPCASLLFVNAQALEHRKALYESRKQECPTIKKDDIYNINYSTISSLTIERIKTKIPQMGRMTMPGSSKPPDPPKINQQLSALANREQWYNWENLPEVKQYIEQAGENGHTWLLIARKKFMNQAILL